MIRALWVVMLLLASTRADTFERFHFQLVRSNDEVTPHLLRKHGLVSVKEGNSIIIPRLFTANHTDSTIVTNKAKKWYKFDFLTISHYKQMVLSSQPPNITLSESVPVQGCVDNRYSETITTMTRTFSRTLLVETGPHMFVTILGAEVGGLMHAGYYNARDEKMSCDVNPGQILQLQAMVTTMTVGVEKQRNITVTKKFLSSEYIEYSDWYQPEIAGPLAFQDTSLACVTNSTMIAC